jgi:hypothetical protein
LIPRPSDDDAAATLSRALDEVADELAWVADQLGLDI